MSCPVEHDTHCNTLQHIVEHDNVCNYTATHCNTLQHTATHCNKHDNVCNYTATHCNTVQHTATHCNTLWQTRQCMQLHWPYSHIRTWIASHHTQTHEWIMSRTVHDNSCNNCGPSHGDTWVLSRHTHTWMSHVTVHVNGWRNCGS